MWGRPVAPLLVSLFAYCTQLVTLRQVGDGQGYCISQETNNLYDYLKGLYAQGLEEARAGHAFDK